MSTKKGQKRTKKTKSKSKAKGVQWKKLNGIGHRCVMILKSGKWRFKPNSACGKAKGAAKKKR